jgi:hypothetical protein
MEDLKFTDEDGDSVRFEFDVEDENGVLFVDADTSGAYVTREEAVRLRDALDEILVDKPKADPRPASALAADAMLRARFMPSRPTFPVPAAEPTLSALSAIEAVVNSASRTAAVKAIIEEARA